MAIFRQIHTSFWNDGFVLDLTPEEKYFYIYLLTNSKTSACGVYELPLKIAENETGYNRETVEKLLSRFIEYGKIEYDFSTKEIILKNWLKFNNSTKSPTTKACIAKELKGIKNERFRELINNILCPIQAPSIPHPYPIGDKDKDKDKDKDRDKDTDKDRENNAPSKSLVEQELNLILTRLSDADYLNLLALYTAKLISNDKAKERLNDLILQYDGWKANNMDIVLDFPVIRKWVIHDLKPKETAKSGYKKQEIDNSSIDFS